MTQLRIERVNKESIEIVTELYNAINGLGTDNELFEKALKKINADNIYEVNELWNLSVGSEYGESKRIYPSLEEYIQSNGEI